LRRPSRPSRFVVPGNEPPTVHDTSDGEDGVAAQRKGGRLKGAQPMVGGGWVVDEPGSRVALRLERFCSAPGKAVWLEAGADLGALREAVMPDECRPCP
jgi:hypothetical protein